MAYELNGATFEADEEGYLIDLSTWNEDLAGLIAKDEDIDMGDLLTRNTGYGRGINAMIANQPDKLAFPDEKRAIGEDAQSPVALSQTIA